MSQIVRPGTREARNGITGNYALHRRVKLTRVSLSIVETLKRGRETLPAPNPAEDEANPSGQEISKKNATVLYRLRPPRPAIDQTSVTVSQTFRVQRGLANRAPLPFNFPDRQCNSLLSGAIYYLHGGSLYFVVFACKTLDRKKEVRTSWMFLLR